LAEIDTALLKNGLIKVRFEAERALIRDYVAEISAKLSCEHVGGVGKVGIFFREMPEE
jgi:RNA-binding protein